MRFVGLDALAPKAAPTIIVVRHGATELNAQGPTGDGAEERLRGWLDVPLNAQGKAEAVATAEKFGGGVKISRIVASDLQRTMDTARKIADRVGVDVEPEPSFRPWNLGVMHGLPVKKILPWMLWYLERDSKVPEGSNESFHDFQIRTLTAFKMLMDEAIQHAADGAIVVVCHSRNTRALKGWLNRGANDIHDIDKEPILAPTEVVQTGQPMVVQHIEGTWRHVPTEDVLGHYVVVGGGMLDHCTEFTLVKSDDGKTLLVKRNALDEVVGQVGEVLAGIPSVCGVIMGGPQPERGLIAGAVEVGAAIFFPTALRVVVGAIGVLRIGYGAYRLIRPAPQAKAEQKQEQTTQTESVMVPQ